MIVPKSVAEKIDEVYRELAHVNEQDRHIWIQYEFLSWQWLLLVLLSIIPWLVWWKLRKKESTSRLLYGAFFVMWFSMLLDSFGTELGLWDYRYEILPFFFAASSRFMNGHLLYSIFLYVCFHVCY